VLEDLRVELRIAEELLLEGATELVLEETGVLVLEETGVLVLELIGVLDLVEETSVEEDTMVDETTGWYLSVNVPSRLYFIQLEYVWP
jgi:hypothetical protein